MNHDAHERLARAVLKHLGRLLIDETDRGALRAPAGGGGHSSAALALQAELAQLGHTLDAAALGWIDRLADTGETALLARVHARTLEGAREATGAHVRYRPLFRHFPDGVPDDLEYLVRRVVAAWTNHITPHLTNERQRVLACGHFVNEAMFDIAEFGACPICQRQDPTLEVGFDDVARPTEGTVVRIVAAVRPSEVRALAEAKLRIAAPLHPDARVIVEALYGATPWSRPVPEDVGLKENAAIALAARARAIGADALGPECAPHLRTATDVLRLAAALGASDPSLADKQPIRLDRAERRLVLAQLERLRDDGGREMMRRRPWFLHLARHLHVGAHAKRYPRTAALVDRLRNTPATLEKPGTALERAMDAARDAPQGALALGALLANGHYGPGEYARRLDFMLRNAHGEGAPIVERFAADIAPALATERLLELRALFRARGAPEAGPAQRLVSPKGGVAKMHVADDTRAPVDARWCAGVERACAKALKSRFAAGAPLGAVWVDPQLEGIVLGLDLRNAGEGRRALGRGSRVALEPAETTRLFLWWKESEGSGRVDVDLSAVAYDAKWAYAGHVDYTQLAAEWAVHSGDLQSAPAGAAEFIDIDRAVALRAGVRYILMSVISFTGQPFDAFTAHAGAMARNDTAGQRLDPTTVETKFAIEHEGVTHLPVVLDLEENALVWADLSMGGGRHMNVSRASERLAAATQAILRHGRERPTMHDLVALQVEARGTRVPDAARAHAAREVTLADVAADPGEATRTWLAHP